MGYLEQRRVEGAQVRRHLSAKVKPEDDTHAVRSVFGIVKERVVEHHSLALLPKVPLPSVDEGHIMPVVVFPAGVYAQPTRTLLVVFRDHDCEVVTEEPFPISPMRCDVLPGFKHRKKCRVQTLDVAQKRGGLGSEGTILVNEAMRLEHQRFPGDGVNPAARVVTGKFLDVDHMVPDVEQIDAFTPNVTIARFELGQSWVIAVIVVDESRRTDEEACTFGTLK